MSKRGLLILVVTFVFVVIAAAFSYLHMKADVEPVSVDAETLASFDPTLTVDFAGDLEARQANEIGPDLGY